MAENSAPKPELDLFGHPVQPIRDRRGRPSYAKSKENQQFIVTMRAAGWSQGRIAEQMGCDEKTLRKYFSRELAEAADILEAEALAVIYAKMRQGNVSAARTMRQIAQEGRKETPFADYPAHNPGPQPSPEKSEAERAEETLARMGKKERLDHEAQTPSGSWATILKH